VTGRKPGTPEPGSAHRPEPEEEPSVTQASTIQARLRQAAGLPEALEAGFDAFEAIRMAAREHQDQAPGLFAAFMTAADAAVDGREALTVAPSLPPSGRARPSRAVPADADAGQAADRLAVLAAVLRDRLTLAAGQADTAGDRDACQDAAAAAGRVCELMAPDEHDTGLR
jgi:hypothetical protein